MPKPTPPKAKAPRKRAPNIHRTPHDGMALFTREQTAEVLNISTATVRRLEKAGKLDVIKLFDAPTGKGFNPAAQVRALAERRT